MMKLKENNLIKDADIFILIEGNPIKKNIIEFLKDKKVVLFGLPGAFTSVCSAKHLPGYVDMFDKYKLKGVDDIVCIAVNDPFVMDAWGKIHNTKNKIIMIADPFLNFTMSIGAEVDKSARGLGIRSCRYTMMIENLKVTRLKEEEETSSCEISAAENFFSLI